MESRPDREGAARIGTGLPTPLGPSPSREGKLNLALWAPGAERVELEVRGRSAEVARLDPGRHRTDSIWHVELPRPPQGEPFVYRWKLDGGEGLLDPWAPIVVGGERWGAEEALAGRRKDRWSAWQSDDFDWQGVEPPRIDPRSRVVYEVSLRGFTAHPSAEVEAPGTFRGLIEKLPHLVRLGVTSIELLPIAEFDELELDRRSPVDGNRLRNLWGYSPISFLAPKASLASSAEPGASVDELKMLVRECHRMGLEVLLDVVFNHTGEKELGPGDPVYSWVELDRAGYYLFDPAGSRIDVTGCGNTFASAGSAGGELILGALRHWRREYRIDGFRFDLASALTRDERGEPDPDPGLVQRIDADPELAECVLIAEAWDAGGLYQVGQFPRWGRWKEWNGPFRDDVRRFVRGDGGSARPLARRLLGSPDLYSATTEGAGHSINYVASHDGFPLADVVSFAGKHNEANGESNRDGDAWSPSWNGGVEGPTDDLSLLELRRRQVEMMLVLLFLARGTPMLLAGDELGRTQGGNNNAYCQDNAVGWVDWSRLAEHGSRVELVRRLIALRRRFPALSSFEQPVDGSVFGRPEVIWHGRSPNRPDWEATEPFLAVQWVDGQAGDLYAAFNPTRNEVDVELPPPPERHGWRLELATAGRFRLPRTGSVACRSGETLILSAGP